MKFPFFNRRPKENGHVQRPRNGSLRGYFAKATERNLYGWTTHSEPIDYYLQTNLRKLRARSRELIRQNEFGKRFIDVIENNVVGPMGANFQSHVMMQDGTTADKFASKEIEKHWQDWCRKENCDFQGKLNFLEMQKLAIKTAAQDGEFILRRHMTGKYRYQLEFIDPELLDIETRVIRLENGNAVRLGVEYDDNNRVVAYHFRTKYRDHQVGYHSGRIYRVPASQVIHGFRVEHIDQSRGVPWLHSALTTGKSLDSFDESAMTAARAGAMAAFALTNKDSGVGQHKYQGDLETDNGNDSFQTLESGQVVDFGDKMLTSIDPNYPHEFYWDFVKARLRRFSRGAGISYHTMSGDLESVNYSSIRTDMVEDRDGYKGCQIWLRDRLWLPVWEDFVTYGIMSGRLTIGGQMPLRAIDSYLPVKIGARRWSWIDPQNDMKANQNAVELKLKSRSQLMREQGDDPETVWEEIAEENRRMEELGIMTKPDESGNEGGNGQNTVSAD